MERVAKEGDSPVPETLVGYLIRFPSTSEHDGTLREAGGATLQG